MKHKKKIIGFTCGTFDLCHPGHMLLFKEARANCDYLIAGLQIDPSLDRPGKNKPVQTLKERLILLEGCKYIDEIFIYKDEKALYRFLRKKQIDIRFLGDDYRDKGYTGDDLPHKKHLVSRSHGWSSGNLRERVMDAEMQRLVHDAQNAKEFFDCKICGAIGNWEEFINKGLCHADKPEFKKK